MQSSNRLFEQPSRLGFEAILNLSNGNAAINLVPAHLQKVKARKESLIDKTRAAVQERLTKEINYWDHRATTLKDQELAGQVNARLNSEKARERADDLTGRLQKTSSGT